MLRFIKNVYNRTKFHTKLIITYSSIVVLILIALSFLFNSYVTIILENSARKDFTQIASTLQQRLNYAFSEMNSVSERIKDNEDLKLQLEKYLQDESQVGNRFTYNMWLKKNLLDAVNINSEIYRVSVFNDKGDFLSTNDFTYDTATLTATIQESEWYKEIVQNGAKEVIVPPHYDDWLENRHIMVYSVVKPIVHFEEIVGFVEVQRRANEYSQVTGGVDNLAVIAIINKDGKVFYSSKKLFSKKLINHYLSFSGNVTSGISVVPNPFSNIQEMVAFTRSDSGWTALVIQNYNDILEPVQSVQNIVLIAVLILMGISFLFVFIFSKRLTVPLRMLKSNIETVNISNLNKHKSRDESFEHDEIEAIHESFLDMQKRLKDSMELEIRSRSLQAKAHFDALQARINPHFIFNMLGVIVNMAEETNQHEIENVCRRLAKMLRYTTQASDAMTTMREEIEHVEDYLSLMKNRFEHRLQYRIDVDESLMSVIVPKFLVQPLIENSLSHGFRDTQVETMRIEIAGGITDDAHWEIRITDNGSGFKQEILANLSKRIDEYKEKVLKHQKPEELSIGGMGIVNTFVRMGLYFGEQAGFDIRNLKSGGALLIIRGPMEFEQQEEKDV